MNSLLRTWAVVRPRAWNALAAAELQSLHDLERFAEAATGRLAVPEARSLLRPDWPSELFRVAVAESQSDDFFRGLPGWEELAKGRNEDEQKAEAKTTTETTTETKAETKAGTQTDAKAHRFSAYSFSHSSVVGADGKRVASTRRRYEDSSGRLKAELEREVGGMKHRAVWNRPEAAQTSAQSTHETSVTGGSADEFEQLWASTPFAKAKAEAEAATPQLEREPRRTSDQ